MARNANASKSVVKLQALVRGYLVRKKFTQLKSEYNDMVKCLEGTDAKVCWKNNEVLCFPVVLHGCVETRERCDVLSENGRQKTLSSNEVGRGDSNTMEKSQIQRSVGGTSINCASKDCICTDNCFHAAPTFDHDGTDDELFESSAINGCEIPPEENVENIKTGKKQHRDITDEIDTIVEDFRPQHSGCHVDTTQCQHGKFPFWLEQKIACMCRHKYCQDSGSQNTTYPRDKLSLLKLREDLTMELLWIEQAIESRINYLAMKKNMDKNN